MPKLPELNEYLTAMVSSVVSTYLLLTFADDQYVQVEVLGNRTLHVLVAYVVPLADDHSDEVALVERIRSSLSTMNDIDKIASIHVNTLRWTPKGGYEIGMVDEENGYTTQPLA